MRHALPGPGHGNLRRRRLFLLLSTKNLGAYGDGGLCFTRDPALAEAIRQIRVYGCGQTYTAERRGSTAGWTSCRPRSWTCNSATCRRGSKSAAAWPAGTTLISRR